jgi:hypothetical protein
MGVGSGVETGVGESVAGTGAGVLDGVGIKVDANEGVKEAVGEVLTNGAAEILGEGEVFLVLLETTEAAGLEDADMFFTIWA